ncbi:FLYWCH zinc finger domain-containing protein [Phthorimaea operculella]|nr:FLYWCH zinc finger domain-containing protein [Phthorimaea operculella]
MTVSQRGRPLIQVGTYTFYQKERRGQKNRWACSSHSSRSCKAQLYTNLENDIVNDLNKYSMVTSRRGQPMLLLVGDEIISVFNKHNHSDGDTTKRPTLVATRGIRAVATWEDTAEDWCVHVLHAEGQIRESEVGLLHSQQPRMPSFHLHLFIVKNLNGKPRAVYKGYPFYLKQQTKISLSWFCTRYPTCTAQLTTTTTGELRRVKNPEHNHQPNQFIMRQMITFEPGVQALLCGSFTFNRKQGSTGRWRWYCSRYHRGCRAGVITTDSLEVLVYTGEHNHAPPNLVKTTSGIYRQIVKNSTGKPVLIYQGYNYCIHGISSATTNWRCSRHSSQKCKARVITLADGFVLRTSGCHTHPATRFDIRDGVFFYY